jgi:ribose transport system substrate-binding protein
MNVRTLLATLCLALAACAHSTSHTTTSTKSTTVAAAPGAKRIGVSIQNREAQFYQDMEAGMRAEAATYGYSLNVVDANRDNALQQSQVEDFISQRVDAIVLTPYDSQAIGSAIAEANRAGIPVFTADIASTSKLGTVVAHVASDNVQGGEEAGKLMCAGVGKTGQVAIINEPEVTSVQDRVRGFLQALAQSCPGVTVVANVDGGGQRDQAESDMSDILQSHRNLSGVFGINDDSALGALTAVKAVGLVGKVTIVGYDATPEARTAIAAGEMYGDAVQYPQQIGKDTIAAIHTYFSGKRPPKVVHVNVGSFTKADAGKSP